MRRSSLFACAHVFTDKKAGIHILVTTPPIININNKITSTACPPSCWGRRLDYVVALLLLLDIVGINQLDAIRCYGTIAVAFRGVQFAKFYQTKSKPNPTYL